MNELVLNTSNDSCLELHQFLRSQTSNDIEGSSESFVDVLTWDQNNCTRLLDDMRGSTPEESSLEFPYYIRTTATIVCTIVLILGTTGNLLVPIVVIKTKELRNSTNLFLINLSIADLLVLIVCMPTVLIELHTKPEIWILGEWMFFWPTILGHLSCRCFQCGGNCFLNFS